MRVCHSSLGELSQRRQRSQSFRGASFLQKSKPLLSTERNQFMNSTKLSRPSDGPRACVGYFRLPLARTLRKEIRGMTLQNPVVLRNFMRHPAWPDPDTTFVWPLNASASSTLDTLDLLDHSSNIGLTQSAKQDGTPALNSQQPSSIPINKRPQNGSKRHENKNSFTPSHLKRSTNA